MSLFANPDLVEKIRESKNTLELHTNTECKRNKTEADVPGFCMVWFDPDAIANISDSQTKWTSIESHMIQ